MRRLLALMALLLLVGGAASCGAESGGTGDCNARVEYHGATYRSHNQLRQSATTAPTSSTSGNVVGCDGEVVDDVAVYEIRGVPASVAIAVVDSQWRGIYVLEGTGPSDWPSEIKAEP